MIFFDFLKFVNFLFFICMARLIDDRLLACLLTDLTEMFIEVCNVCLIDWLLSTLLIYELIDLLGLLWSIFWIWCDA